MRNRHDKPIPLREPSDEVKERNPSEVLFYIPNLIGYARIILLIASFFFMTKSPVEAMSCYFLSSFLDAFDGMAARHFNQSSTFGGLLDMLTDRVSTSALIMAIASFNEYQSYVWILQVVVCLDITAHWAHMYSLMLPQGDDHRDIRHHKKIDLNDNAILHFYYQKGPLFVFCAANELFFICVYLLKFYPDDGRIYWTAVLCFPIMFVKHIFSGVHLCSAAYNIAIYDVESDDVSKEAHHTVEVARMHRSAPSEDDTAPPRLFSNDNW